MHNLISRVATSPIAGRWAVAVLLWLLIWAVVFSGPLRSVMSVWSINDTFNHCFLILPVAIYIVWKQRGAVMDRTPRVSVIGAIAVFGVLGVEALGSAAYIDVMQHAAVFALLPAMTLFIFGWNVVRPLWFPLLYVLFSIPFGEEFFPQFQVITADIAIFLLQSLDIPVYRDGLYITIPNGHFVVAEACSGIRFFIACLVLGTAFAYLNFISRWRAFLFVAFSVVMPVLANGARAFGIIYIGYVTDMQHAVGADHLIYGWFFFAVIICVLVLCGVWFSDGYRRWYDTISLPASGWHVHWSRKTLALSLLPLLAIVVLEQVREQHHEAPFSFEAADMQEVSATQVASLGWTPLIVGADTYLLGNDRANLEVFTAAFRFNEPGRELVSWQNRLYDIDRWTQRATYRQKLAGTESIAVLDLVSVDGQRRLLAYWYVVPHRVTSSAPFAKLQQALNSMMFAPTGGALVAVNHDYSGSVETALNELQAALDEIPMLP